MRSIHYPKCNKKHIQCWCSMFQCQRKIGISRSWKKVIYTITFFKIKTLFNNDVAGVDIGIFTHNVSFYSAYYYCSIYSSYFSYFSFLAKEVDKLFRKLAEENKESRKHHQSNDILHSLMQNEEKSELKSLFLPAHSFTLFVECVETSTSALSYALYELAVNSHCQHRLYNEIIECVNKLDIEEDIDIHSMPYLEGVLLETMRIHPPLMCMQKICSKKYELSKSCHQAKPLTIYPGTPVHIPVQAIHM